jgi:uncharacterized protein (DUF608 family)
MAMTVTCTWPVLRSYSGQNLRKVALPLGGIGTGTISLGGRGDLRDWEVLNRPGKGFQPEYSFFCIRTAVPGQEAQLKILEGSIDPSEYEGAFGTKVNHHGLPRFRECSFEAAYPLGQVVLRDPEFPVTVRLKAFNPLIPTDVSASSIPMVVLKYVVENKSSKPLEVSISGHLQNFIGEDGSIRELVPSNSHPYRNDSHSYREGYEKFDNFNTYMEELNVKGIFLDSHGVPKESERYGTVALAILDGQDVTYRDEWANYSWGDALLEMWEDFADDGKLSNLVSKSDSESKQVNSKGKLFETPLPVASIADFRTLQPGEITEFEFVISWNFPNRHAWLSNEDGDMSEAPYSQDIVGNHYSTLYRDAWDVVIQHENKLKSYELETLRFVQAVCNADIPEVIKEAALFNLSTLRSQTLFRTSDGHYFGWEGVGDHNGSCHGSCTHVWNYEQATSHLFGAMAMDMRELEFTEAMHANGLMSFRIGLPLEKYAKAWGVAAADGQMGAIMKLFREWRLSGDTEWMRKLWPAAKNAMEFCWIPGGWDADQDGVMEGAQHNTMDVEYFGPNPQVGLWYLGALKAISEMASAVGDQSFAAKCSDLYSHGSGWIDANLFNGEFYEQKIIPPMTAGAVAEGLRHESGATNMADPEFQIGKGCLIDQLVGQYLADVCGLGPLVDSKNQLITLESIYKYNSRDEFYSEFNQMRNFVLGDEKGLLMATYPHGGRPRRPFPYFNEVMTGFEYTVAIGMIYQGLTEKGTQVIENIRSRYDGYKRNPFNEAECGHHYARAMASWGALLAWTGQQYDARNGFLTFTRATSEPTPWFTGFGWGTIQQRGEKLHLTVNAGEIYLTHIGINGSLARALPVSGLFAAGESLEF